MGDDKNPGFMSKLVKAFLEQPPRLFKNEEVLPNEQITFGRGVTHHQDVLAKLPKAQRKFVLIGEPTNLTDKEAVAIYTETHGQLKKVCYLPSGEFKTKFFQELAMKLAKKEISLVCYGTVEPFKDEVGVQLELPKWQWLKARLQQEDS